MMSCQRATVLVVVLQVVLTRLVHSTLAVEQNELPALYELEDWRECEIAPEQDWYCVVRVLLTREDAVECLKVNDVKQFRRTLLDRGVCLSRVQRTVEVETMPVNVKFPSKCWNVSDRYILNRSYFPPAMHPDVQSEQAASGLINSRLIARYSHLRAYSEIEYCLKSDPTPVYEQALGVTLAVTLVLAAVLALNARRWILPECSPAKSTPPIKQIVLFDLYKCFGAVGVVLAHCCLFGSFLMPMKNIDLLEEVIAHPYAKFWRLVCPFLMLAFFVMSSMLLTVKLLHGDPSKRPTLGAIISHRLIRLMPVNLLMVAFGALVYDRFAGGGPLLSRQLIVEQGFCRSYWWMNVLFISNFNMQRPCLPDSWYVSADMQLYVVITLALQIMLRFPKHNGAILALLTVCSFLGPFLTILYTDFDPVGPSSLHEMRFFLLGSRFMSQLYTPFYNNLSWSVAGLMAGIVYDRYQRIGDSVKKQKQLLHYITLTMKISFAMLVVMIYATIVASNEESQASSRWWLAFCYSAYKLSGACFISASFLRISLTERATNFNIPRVVRIGAALYYCIYFTHFPIMRIVYSSAVQTMITPWFLIRKAVKVFGITYVLSVVLHYTYENTAIKWLQWIFFGRKR